MINARFDDVDEAKACLANHYRCFEMLAGQAKKNDNLFDEQMFVGKLRETANDYGTVAGLATYAEVHKDICMLN